MNTPIDIEKYASFLCAVHASFAACPRKIRHAPTLRDRYRVATRGIRPTGKPWKRVLEMALKQANPKNGTILEFGVYNGKTLNFLARKRPKATLHGFDSFAGFPQDGRSDWQQDMSVLSLPDTPKNTRLHVGYFEDTLPEFIKNHHTALKHLTLVHIDCDIYSSTKTVLTSLSQYMRPGTIIVFDELMHYVEFARNEFLAFFEFLEQNNLDFEWVATLGKAFPFQQENGKMPPFKFAEYRAQGFFQNQVIRLIPRHEGVHFNAPKAPTALIANLETQL